MKPGWLIALVWVGVSTGLALAQEAPSPEQLRKMYNETLEQLKAAQDRKNELAVRVTELEKELAEARSRIAALESEVDTFSERTFFLRAHYNAWQHFVRNYPQVLERWRVYLESTMVPPPAQVELFNSVWPFPQAE